MSSTWTTTLRLGNGRSVLGRSPFGQGFALLLGAVALLVMIPIAIAAVVFGLLAVAALRVRGWIFRQRGPNGMLDGRKNVRVRMPDEPDSGAGV
jgi:hypothetical protein